MSRTGDALEALYTAIVAAANAPGSPLPPPLQNEELASRLIKGSDGLDRLLNVWDGNGRVDNETLDADTATNGYEIVHDAEVEFAVMGGDRAARRTAFEAGLTAISDALAADRTLAGTVSYASIAEIRRPGSGLVTDGLANALGATITIALQFTSSRPF